MFKCFINYKCNLESREITNTFNPAVENIDLNLKEKK